MKRDFEALAQSTHRGAKQIGKQLVEFTRELFHNWHRARDGTIRRETFLKHHHRLDAEFHETFDVGTRSGDHGCATLCSHMFEGFENLWPFAHDPQLQIEPTNNAAERALQHPVISKQLSFSTQSASGSHFVETLLSVVETCRQQGRDVLTFLYDSLTAKLHGQEEPSLLPNRT